MSKHFLIYISVITIIINSYHYYSAGIGQTGAFIAIDIELERIKQEGIIDVYNTVYKLRHSRMTVVQTLVFHQNNLLWFNTYYVYITGSVHVCV